MKSIGIRVEPSEIYYVILELEDGGNFRFNTKISSTESFK